MADARFCNAEVEEIVGECRHGIDPRDGREYYDTPVIVARMHPDGGKERFHAIFRTYKTYGLGDMYDPDEKMFTITIPDIDDAPPMRPELIPIETLMALYQ